MRTIRYEEEKKVKNTLLVYNEKDKLEAESHQKPDKPQENKLKYNQLGNTLTQTQTYKKGATPNHPWLEGEPPHKTVKT